MKTIKLFSVLALVAVCILCTSCNKEEFDYSNSKWYGIVENGSVILTFRDGTASCFVETSVKDITSANRQTFEARWTGKYTFDLYPTTGEQIVKQFSGTIERNKMFLSSIKGGATSATYQLSRIELVQQ